MNIEFTCSIKGCPFTGTIDWPVDNDGGKPIFESEVVGSNCLTAHHRDTAIKLTEYDWGMGHSTFKGRVGWLRTVEVSVSGNYATITKRR